MSGVRWPLSFDDARELRRRLVQLAEHPGVPLLQTLERQRCVEFLPRVGAAEHVLLDRGTDLPDCVDLAPTAAELAEALPWVSFQDANPDWPAHVAATLADLGRRLGHGV